MPVAPGLKEKLADITHRMLAEKNGGAQPQPVMAGGASAASSASKMVNAYKDALANSGIANANGGLDYNTAGAAGKHAIENNQSRLASDPAFKQSEIARTQQVIADMMAKGKDTSAQEKYLHQNLGFSDPAGNGNTGVAGPVYSGPSGGSSAPPSPGYQSTYTGPDMAGMQNQLNDLYGQRQAAALQQLRNTLQIAQQGYNAQETQAHQSAYAGRNAADVAAAQNEQRTREVMANAGLTGDGQNLTLSAAQGASRLGALSGINQQEANALQDIAQKRSLLQNNEAANETALVQQIGADKAAALLDLLKYGDTRAFQVDQSNYGRYRDDINQQFAQDQFDWNKQTDLADLLGVIGGQQTLAGRAADQADKQANWNAFMDIVNQTGNLGGGPTQNWGSLVRNAGTGAPTLAGQQFQSGEQQRALDNAWTASSQLGKVTPELSQLTGIPAGTSTMQAQQYWNDYNRGVLESDRNFGLQEDRNYLDYLNAIGGDNQEQPETVSAAQAGQLLQQSITKQIGTDPATGKPMYGPLTDPANREKAFVDAFNASGVAPGADVIEMLTRAGYSTDEIAKYKQKYPSAFKSGGGASGSFSTEINASAAKWGVPTDLIEAVIGAESSGDPRAVSGAGAQGLMQLMPATARELGVKDSFNPAQNIEGGTQYLKGLLDTYNGDYAKALAGYNAGGGRVREAIAKYGPNWLDHMPAETQAYVTKILGNLGGG